MKQNGTKLKEKDWTFVLNIQLLINKFNKKNEFKMMKQNGWLTLIKRVCECVSV